MKREEGAVGGIEADRIERLDEDDRGCGGRAGGAERERKGAADVEERIDAESDPRSIESRPGSTSSAQATDERRGSRDGRRGTLVDGLDGGAHVGEGELTMLTDDEGDAAA